MKEPILSQEEAFTLAQRFEATEDNDNIASVVALTPLELEQFVSAILEKLCGEPAAHMFPSDLERFKTSETFAQAYSVAVGNPDEHSVPLYALNRSKA